MAGRRGAMPVVLLLAVLLAASLPVPVVAQSGTVQWHYVVRPRLDGTGIVDVELSLVGAKDVVKNITFDPSTAPYPVSGLRCPENPCEDTGSGHTLTVKNPVERIVFRVDVGRSSPKGDAAVSHLGTEWGVFKAEALSVPFKFTYPAGAPPTWQGIVVVSDLPAGWSTTTAWARPTADPDYYALPPGEALPRGFIALGDYDEEIQQAAGRTVRYARLGAAPSYEVELWEYLAEATPYLRTVYGDAPGPTIAVISAGSPMITGGLGAHDSFFVHEASDLRTAAHEFTHVWQHFAGGDAGGDSSVWLHEGDAEVHGTVSLFAAGFWSLEEVNAFFQAIWDDRGAPPLSDVSLAHAGYTGDGERVAYGKGAITLLALDASIAVNTEGRYGLADLLQHLNALAAGGDPGATTVTNAETVEALADITGRDFSPFWSQYVYGVDWPPWQPLEGKGHLLVTNVTFRPTVPLAGEDVIAVVRVENRGYGVLERNFTLELDGVPQASRTVRLDVGERAFLEFPFKAPAEGATHDVKVGAHTTTLEVATPAYIVPIDVRVDPESPGALQPVDLYVYLKNEGDLAADANLLLLVEGVAAGERTVTVGGGATRIVDLQGSLPVEGPNRVTVRVTAEGRLASQNVTLVAGPADRDGDGVPDAEDDYPEDPAYGERTFLTDLQRRVPAPGLVLVAALAAAVALTAGRGRWRARR